MASITVYQSNVRAAPVAGVKQQAVSGGFGEGIGEALQETGQAVGQFAKAKDAYEARVDEAAALEISNALSEQVRGIEQGYLATQGRGAMDGAAQARSDWRRRADEALASATTDRQKAMLGGLIARGYDRFQTQADSHLLKETESYTTTQEDAHVATLTREVSDLPLGSSERTDAMIQLGQALDGIKARRGQSDEWRRETGFQTFSSIHVATIGALRDADPEGALDYIREHEDQIDPDKLASLLPQVRDEAYAFKADRLMRGALDGIPVQPKAEVAPDGAPTVMEVIPPIAARAGSQFGPRRGRMHRGTDFPAANGTSVVAALPGVARVKNDPDGFGRYVEIDHGGGVVTRYAHLSAAHVQDGQRVEQGDLIALSGGVQGADGAGNSEGPHLHFEYLVGGQARDPQAAIGRRATVTEQTASPGGQMFVTEEDIRDRAREMAGGDVRLEQALIRAGSQALGDRYQARDRAESEGRRALDDWWAQNPDATWEQVPSALKNAVSPTVRQSVRNSMDSRTDDGADPVVANNRYAALLDVAQLQPREFMALVDSGELDTQRQLLGETRYLSLRNRARDIAGTAQNAAANYNPLSGIDSVVKTYARSAGIETGQDATPADAQRFAMLQMSLETAARSERARLGREPTTDEMFGLLNVITANARSGSERGALFETGGRLENIIVPGRQTQDIRRELVAQGVRSPTMDQIRRVYVARLRDGSYSPQ